ncbi:Oidioi.mRNA.OKI2018_I69.XSR.g14650.t1.cds [Oikopleura dioica]|uniref:Oidioi.mRNA.OKI2018_I69.XSR.g14644.t1.cds n=1 Tax=Oikopleura dioica TaxID=34765 RepID=A0ABN7SGR6_OIKDI|nr:Oidioi.mRNA.OKI2018_I69.XSR.g14644.t1.cds [Oikopleura dioica]CAG5096506.1 Oidioi.mRNA.OKI2018_I69.XSR.g14650.t1.cds [Oikopleura dioica]
MSGNAPYAETCTIFYPEDSSAEPTVPMPIETAGLTGEMTPERMLMIVILVLVVIGMVTFLCLKCKDCCSNAFNTFLDGVYSFIPCIKIEENETDHVAGKTTPIPQTVKNENPQPTKRARSRSRSRSRNGRGRSRTRKRGDTVRNERSRIQEVGEKFDRCHKTPPPRPAPPATAPPSTDFPPPPAQMLLPKPEIKKPKEEPGETFFGEAVTPMTKTYLKKKHTEFKLERMDRELENLDSPSRQPFLRRMGNLFFSHPIEVSKSSPCLLSPEPNRRQMETIEEDSDEEIRPDQTVLALPAPVVAHVEEIQKRKKKPTRKPTRASARISARDSISYPK